MEIRTLTAKHGILWIKSALLIFIKKPSFFIAVVLLYFLVKQGILLLPPFLPLWLLHMLRVLISVYFAAAVMVGCDLIASSHNQQGASYKTHPFLHVWGVVLKKKNILLLALITSIVFALKGYGFRSIPTEVFINLFGEILYRPFVLVTLFAVISSFLWVVTTALFCMTPAIVFWHPVSSVKAIFYNARAFFKNWKAWLCWILVIQLFVFTVYIPFFFLIVKYFGSLNEIQQLITQYHTGINNTLLLFFSFFISTCYYFAYKDSFAPEQESLAEVDADADTATVSLPQ